MSSTESDTESDSEWEEDDEPEESPTKVLKAMDLNQVFTEGAFDFCVGLDTMEASEGDECDSGQDHSDQELESTNDDTNMDDEDDTKKHAKWKERAVKQSEDPKNRDQAQEDQK
jgi:hypothetical protein